MWNQSSDSNELKKMNVSIIVTDEDTEVQSTTADNKIDKSLSSGSNQKFDFDSSGGCGGGIDSGFLSGPQLERCEIDYDIDNDNIDNKVNNQIDINLQKSNSTGAPVAAATATISGYIDSGCIEDDDEEEEEDFNQPRRIDKGTITESSGNMIIENDNSLTELFCTLSLRSNQHLNNLNGTQQQQQQTISTDKKSIKDITSNNENINKKWETYYTQNSDGDTQLHLACITGYVNVIAALIRMAPHPCLLDIQNDDAQSALHIATLTAQPLVIRMLLVAGAEPTLRDRNGNTPLHLACISGDLQCVKALTIPISSSELQEAQRLTTQQTINTPLKLNNNNFNDRQIIQPEYFPCAELPTDLEIRNFDGERCVHLAAQGSHIDVLRHLFFFGADINAREGKSGRTPLHISIEQCNENLANFLLEECQQKINLETVTYSGLTPYQFACILDNHKLQIDLEKFGAEPLTPPESDTDGSDIESEFDDTQNYDRFGEQGYFISSHNGVHAINVA